MSSELTKAGFTPGPWRIHNNGADTAGEVAVVYCTSAGYANICGARDREWSESANDANAHLIAAAPDLYEALENLIAWIDPNENYDEPQTNAAYAALAKARGEAT